MSNPDVAEVFGKIFAIYNLILIVVSIILSPMVVFVCLKSKKLRSSSTFKLLAISGVNDLIACIPWNLECFSNTFFDFEPYYRSLFYCRVISVFLEFTVLEFTSWMLVSISLDRLLSISFKNWSTKYFKDSRPWIYSIVLLLIIAAINFNEVFIAGYSFTVNGTEIIVCFDNRPDDFQWYHIMSKIFVYFGFIVPYVLLILLNSLIIIKATKYERLWKRESMASNSSIESRAAKRKTEMTRTILFITFLYIALSLPGTIQTGYVYGYILNLDIHISNMIINLVNCIQFTYSAFNFVILYFSNRLFAEEAKLMFNIKRYSGRVTSLRTGTNP